MAFHINKTAVVLLAASLPQMAHAGTATRAAFGRTADGAAVEAVTLTNDKGMSARIISYGAILQALTVPDRNGTPGDVVLGYSDMTGYLEKPNYFGATVGRYANRIADGRFVLDGKAYQLARNDGPNSLHGGVAGFDRKLWTITKVESGARPSVTMTYTSPDGEEGFPGKLSVTARYQIDDAGNLAIDYTATTDKPTIVNLTHHSYFNLAGEGSGKQVLDHRITIPAAAYTPVNANLIPTGEIRPVEGTPFDFRKAAPVGARIRDGRDAQIVFGRGYDHNWVVQKAPSAAPVLHARVEDPASGRVMEVLSNQPGLQFYTGNFIDGTIVGKSGLVYRQSDALCLEPQVFPDTPNQPAFGSARLEPGQTYTNRIVLRFSTTG